MAICLTSIFCYDKQILILTYFFFFFFAILRWSDKMKVAQYESMHISTHFIAFPINKNTSQRHKYQWGTLNDLT